MKSSTLKSPAKAPVSASPVRASTSTKAKKSPPKSEISSRPSPKARQFFPEEKEEALVIDIGKISSDDNNHGLQRNTTASSSANMMITDNDSEVSSITQSTMDPPSPKKGRSNSIGKKSQPDYHPSKFSPERDVVVVPSKGYTPKAKPLGTTSPSPEKAEVPLSKSKTPSRSTTPGRTTSPRVRPVPTPVLSPKDRARAQAQADEERRKALEEEYERQLEVERLEAIRMEEERLEAIRLEEERIERERLEAERIERERLERIERERLEAEARERARAEAKRFAIETERLKVEEAARLEAEKKAALKAKADKTKADQDSSRLKKDKERKQATERANQAEMEKKAAVDAAKQKLIADRKAAQDAVRAKATATVPKRQIVVDTSAGDVPSASASSSPTKPMVAPKSPAARVSPRAVTSSSAAKAPVVDDDRKAAARARIEAERREQQEKERIAAEKKAAIEFAKSEAKRVAAEEAARKEEKRKANLLNAAIAEQERKVTAAAAKARTEEERKLALESLRESSASESGRKVTEKRDRKSSAGMERSMPSSSRNSFRSVDVEALQREAEIEMERQVALEKERDELNASIAREEEERYRQLAADIKLQEEFAAAELDAQERVEEEARMKAENDAMAAKNAQEKRSKSPARSTSPKASRIPVPSSALSSTSPVTGRKSINSTATAIPTPANTSPRSLSRLSNMFSFGGSSKSKKLDEQEKAKAAEEARIQGELEKLEATQRERERLDQLKAEALAKTIAEAKATAELERIANEKAEAEKRELLQKQQEKARLEAQQLEKERERKEKERLEKERVAAIALKHQQARDEELRLQELQRIEEEERLQAEENRIAAELARRKALLPRETATSRLRAASPRATTPSSSRPRSPRAVTPSAQPSPRVAVSPNRVTPSASKSSIPPVTSPSPRQTSPRGTRSPAPAAKAAGAIKQVSTPSKPNQSPRLSPVKEVPVLETVAMESDHMPSPPHAMRGRSSLKADKLEGVNSLEAFAEEEEDEPVHIPKVILSPPAPPTVSTHADMEKKRVAELTAAMELTRLEEDRKLSEEQALRKANEQHKAKKAEKQEADRRAAHAEVEIQRAIKEAQAIEIAEAEARAQREVEMRRSGLQQLIVLGRDNKLIEGLARRLDELIQILMNFKCNKESGEGFAKRLGQVAYILYTVLKSNPNLPEREYSTCIDDMAQILIEAKKYLIQLAYPGFLVLLLRGDEPKLKFEEYDTKIIDLLTDIVTIFHMESNKKYMMNKVLYNFVVIDEDTVKTSKRDPQTMKSIAKLLGVDMAEMNKEVNETLKRLNYMIQDVTEKGAQRQLRHPAMKTFWRLNLSSTYKIDNKDLIQVAIKYIHTEINPAISDEELGSISLKMQRTLAILDDSSANTITVFELNQSTKYLDPNLDFIEVIKKLCAQTTLKIFPSLTEEQREKVIWGDGIREVVHATLRSAGSWTVIFGPSNSGKSHRWLVGAHELVASDAVVWIDFRNVKTSSDMLSTIATQLSLSVLSLDDVMLEFQRLLDSSLEHLSSHCCIVLDHLNLAILDQIGPFMKILKKLQAALRIAIVVITTNTTKPSIAALTSLSKSGKIVIPDEMMTCFEVPALEKDEAIQLCQHLDVYDPAMLAMAGRRLPGEIMRIQNLRTSSLSSIINNDKHSSPGSMTDALIVDMLSEYDTLCAICLYYPLSGRDGHGILFHKALAWELCHKALEENIDLWNGCMDKLLSTGWLRLVGDEGYMISSTSTLPNHPTWTFISEGDQWETYYRYWAKQAVHINDLLSSKEQLLGCSFFDSSRHHFETIFNDIGVKPVLFGRVRAPIILAMVCDISSNISNIFEYRFAAVDGLAVSKALLRILCDGDESGMLTDDRYWKNNASLQPIIVRAAVNLGWYLNRTTQSQVAEQVILSAIQYVDESDALNYAYALNKLAIIYRTLGKKEESLATHQKCLNIRMKALGENHVETAQSLNNIAIVLNAIGEKEEALTTHSKCLKIRIALLGDKHASTGDTYYNMATVLKDLGKKEETIDCYEKAKIAYIATYGEAHSYVKDVGKKIAALN